MTARFVAATGLTIAALAAHAPAQAQTRAEERACAALAGWSGGPEDLTITEARFYANRTVAARPGAETTLPPHCHVAGSFERRTGVDGKEYAIGFAINMPAEWNGRFMFQGGGGLNGAIREPVGSQAAGERTRARARLRGRRDGQRSSGQRLRRQLHGRSAGAAEFPVSSQCEDGRSRASDRRGVLRRGAASQVLCRLLDRWTRRHDHGAALSVSVRRHRLRRSCDANDRQQSRAALDQQSVRQGEGRDAARSVHAGRGAARHECAHAALRCARRSGGRAHLQPHVVRLRPDRACVLGLVAQLRSASPTTRPTRLREPWPGP